MIFWCLLVFAGVFLAFGKLMMEKQMQRIISVGKSFNGKITDAKTPQWEPT